MNATPPQPDLAGARYWRAWPRALALVLLWLALSEGQAHINLGLGLLVVGASWWLSVWLLPPSPQAWSVPGVLRFILKFVWHSVRGGVQVAQLALHPGPMRQLQPQVQSLHLDASLTPTQRALLVATLNLMPGTLCVDWQNQTLTIHTLDPRQDVAAEVALVQRWIGNMRRSPP